MTNKNKMSKFKKWLGDTFFKNNKVKDKENNTKKLKHPITFLIESEDKIANSIISKCVGDDWDKELRQRALQVRNYRDWRDVVGLSMMRNPHMPPKELARLINYAYKYLAKCWSLRLFEEDDSSNIKHFTVGKLIQGCKESHNKVPIIALNRIFNLITVDLDLVEDVSPATMADGTKEFSEVLSAFAKGVKGGWGEREMAAFARENLEAMSVLLALAVRALQGEVG